MLAALRMTNGAPTFVVVLMAFGVLQVLLPALWRWWRGGGGTDGGVTAATPATAALVVAALGLGFGSTGEAWAQAPATSPAPAAKVQAAPPSGAIRSPAGARFPGPDSVEHEVRVEDEYVFGTARVRWDATAGQVLPLLREPGVLTRSGHATNAARLVQVVQGGKPVQVLVAETTGRLEFDVDYQVRVAVSDGAKGFVLPVEPGLVNRAPADAARVGCRRHLAQAVLVRGESGGRDQHGGDAGVESGEPDVDRVAAAVP